jgi:predicted kinase
VAAFHKSAEILASAGGASGITEVIKENIALLRQFTERPFSASAVKNYAEAVRKALASVSDLLERRRESGFVRRCHGDLHLNNVCLVEGKPVLFDAIEFNEAFSAIDVLYDAAFLLMELEHHALRVLANAFLNRYLEKTGGYTGLAALPLFLSCRAAIRAHVTATLATKSFDRAETLNEDARRFLDDAIRFLEPCPPMLVAIGGVSGTGKSTLARGLAPLLGRTPGAVVLRSDVLRKALFSVDETTRLPEPAYAREVSARVYEHLVEYARTILADGQAVIVDAVFGTACERKQIASVARAIPFKGLWLQAPQSVLETRITSRSGDASDATIAVLNRQLGSVTRPENWAVVDASKSPEQILSAAGAAVMTTYGGSS